jgi:hypothetical protein
MSAWKTDKKWSDKYLVDIKRILGEHLIGEPPKEEDAERNTDLMVLRMDAVRIGCRIRKYCYYPSYNGEFTIRAGRPSGVKTELTKIIEGWGDYFFYGFANEDQTGLHAWGLADMKVFRLWFNRYLVLNNGQVPGKSRGNADGSSTFIAFSWMDFPNNFLIASEGLEVRKAA